MPREKISHEGRNISLCDLTGEPLVVARRLLDCDASAERQAQQLFGWEHAAPIGNRHNYPIDLILLDQTADISRQSYYLRIDQALADQFRFVIYEPDNVKARGASFESRPRQLNSLIARAQYQHPLAHAELWMAGAPGDDEPPRGNDRKDQHHVYQEYPAA